MPQTSAIQTFTTTGKPTGPTGIEVPPDIMAALGPKKTPAVQITVAGHGLAGHSLAGYSYRSTVAVRGGAFMVPLSAAHRAAAGVQAGQQVQVTLALDTAARTVTLPAELEQALVDAGVKAAYDALPLSRQKESARQVEDARTDETRQRRVARIVAQLSGP